MAAFFTFFFVVAAAILFGIFFLIFKIIWLILKKKQNFWPLILSGVITLLIMALVALAVYKSYTQFVKPLKPIVLAASANTKPVYGQHFYADRQHGFTLTTFDGMVLSDWISLSRENSLKLGFDVNASKLKQQNNPDNFRGIAIARTSNKVANTATEFFEKQFFPALQQDVRLKQIVQISSGPTPISVGQGASAAYVEGIIRSDKSPQQSMPATLLVVVRGTETYFIGGMGNTPVDKTVTSFSFAN